MILNDKNNRDNAYEVRARPLDRKVDGGQILKLQKERSNLLVFYRNDFYQLYGVKGAKPNSLGYPLEGYDTLLLVKEVLGETRIQVLEVLNENFNGKTVGTESQDSLKPEPAPGVRPSAQAPKASPAPLKNTTTQANGNLMDLMADYESLILNPSHR